MKTHTFFIIVLLIITKSYSQETSKIKDIDVTVNTINQSNYQITRDTIILDKPEYGLKTKTYLTMKVDKNQLKKYENLVYTTMSLDGNSREMTTSTTFYYNENKLIKVEGRAKLLLSMSEAMLKQIIK